MTPLLVGAYRQDSNVTGIDGDQNNNAASNSGAAYVFTRTNGVWSQQAYLKASNTDAQDEFGYDEAISGDTILVGAALEDSNTMGVNGDEGNNAAVNSGALLRLCPSSPFMEPTSVSQSLQHRCPGHEFGYSVAATTHHLLIGARFEDSQSTGINGDGDNDLASISGAAYLLFQLCRMASHGVNKRISKHPLATNSSDRFEPYRLTLGKYPRGWRSLRR